MTIRWSEEVILTHIIDLLHATIQPIRAYSDTYASNTKQVFFTLKHTTNQIKVIKTRKRMLEVIETNKKKTKREKPC